MQRWRPFKPMRIANKAYTPQKFSGFRVYFLVVLIEYAKQFLPAGPAYEFPFGPQTLNCDDVTDF